MKAPVFTTEGEKSGERELPEALFDGVVHQPAMWQTVKAMMSNQRQATASTKTRAQVAGGSRKPWRQKGTGRSRQGSTRSAQWRGGGSVFGPRPNRNFTQKVPRKVKWLARRSAFNARAQDGAIVLLDAFPLAEPKTKLIVGLLDKLDVSGNVLILTDGVRESIHLSSRNLAGVVVRPFGEESAYDLLWADSIVLEVSALERAAEVAHA
ncbi:MAG: 50S ribosomal protein L4 [Longimicrobiales bacterium]